LLDLQSDVKRLLEKGLIEMGHARALLSPQDDKQMEIATKVVEKGLTVRAVEKLIKEQGKDKSVEAKQVDTDTLRLQDELSEKTGAKVIIRHQHNGRGKLVFSYTSLEELEGIIGRIR
jgi:ParB family chromosome partitioning protein